MDSIRNDESPAKKSSFGRRFLVIGIPVLVLLLLGGIFLTRYLDDQKLRNQQLRFEAEKHEMSETLQTSYTDVQHKDIRLFSLALAWAVRSELMRENYDQIDQYFIELIKQNGFGTVMLMDTQGFVKVSSDRNLQGKLFSTLYPSLSLNEEQLVSYPLSGTRSLFVLPVMGLNAKIGTIAFLYTYRTLGSP